MNESNPFAGQPGGSAGGGKAAAAGWLAAVLLAVAAGVLGWLWYSARVSQREMDGLRANLADKSAGLANAQEEIQRKQAQIAALQAQVADLETEKKKAVQQGKSLENEMRADLESKDVTISNLKGKLTVNILDRIMFDSGEAVLKPDGEAVLQKVAAILVKHPEIKIHVIGHTDNVPIRAGARSRFASNWELSAARALAAVHYLSEQGGIDPRRMGAVGYGEFRPLADNATVEGRAKNRRIAIAILSDELAGADTIPATPVAVSTNEPPVTESAPVPPAQ
jgi:chemotaxis protein MotB